MHRPAFAIEKIVEKAPDQVTDTLQFFGGQFITSVPPFF